MGWSVVQYKKGLTGCVVLDALKRESALWSGLGSGDQGCCAGQARVRPHVFSHEVFSSVVKIKKIRKKFLKRNVLVTRKPRLWEGGGGDNDSSIFGFQSKVYQFEISVVMFCSDMLQCFSDDFPYAPERNSPQAFRHWQKRQMPFRIRLEFHGNQEGGLWFGPLNRLLWCVLLRVIFVLLIASMYQLRIRKNGQPELPVRRIRQRWLIVHIPQWRDLPIHCQIQGFCVLVSPALSEGHGGFFSAEPLPNPQASVPPRDPPGRRLLLHSTEHMSTSSPCSGMPDDVASFSWSSKVIGKNQWRTLNNSLDWS